MPWSVARVVFRSAGVETGQGWDKTIAKHADAEMGMFEGPLLDAISEHNLCGEKFTKIYDLSVEEHTEVQKHLAALTIKQSDFSDVYPLSLSEDALQNTDGIPVVVDVVRNTDGIGVVYANAIKLTTREKILVQEYTDEPERFTSEFDEIVGLKFKTVQLFSVVWVPHEHNSIEIRTDYPDGMSTDQAHAVQSSIRREFNQFNLVELGDPVDLFGLLESIYFDESEGQVVELGFLTTTASVKLEKMRKPNMDLRLEKYHMSGKQGLGTPIEPYRISVRWTIPLDDLRLIPELTLAGTARGRSTIGSVGSVGISGATVRNCAGRVDYEFVLHRIRIHLAQVEAKAEEK